MSQKILSLTLLGSDGVYFFFLPLLRGKTRTDWLAGFGLDVVVSET